MKKITRITPLKLSLRVKQSNLISCREIASYRARNDINSKVMTSARWTWVNNDNGITLIELIIVISIIAILAVAFGFEYRNWMGRYKAESQVKELYVDLMNARASAMERNRIHFATGTAGQYSIYEDTDPWPDGNGTLELASDALLPGYPKTVEYAMTWTGPGSRIDFDRRGVMSPSGNIYLTSSSDPAVSVHRDYDCLAITQTRINMGKWNGATCAEK